MPRLVVTFSDGTKASKEISRKANPAKARSDGRGALVAQLRSIHITPTRQFDAIRERVALIDEQVRDNRTPNAKRRKLLALRNELTRKAQWLADQIANELSKPALVISTQRKSFFG